MAVELQLLKVADLPGQSAVAYTGWSKDRATNDDLLVEFGDTAENRLTLLNSGVLERHHPKGHKRYIDVLDEIRNGMIDAATTVIKAALKRSGKSGTELLYLASSTPPDREGLWGVEIAKRCDIEEVRFSYMACNGAAGALLDVLNQPDLKNASVVIAGDEAIGYFVRPDNLVEVAVFDSGAAAFAFTPRNIELINGQTVIIPDKQAVISVPNMYDLPNEGLLPLPWWYSLEDDSAEVFRYCQKGIYQRLPMSEDPDHILMRGGETTKYFARAIPPIVATVLKDFYQDSQIQEKFAGQVINPWVSHQPSRGVIDIVQRQIGKLLKDTNIPVPEIPWVLDRTRMGNVSSATMLVALTELASQIEPGKVFNITAYGIGSSVTSMNLLFSP